MKHNTLQIMRPVVETRPLKSFLRVADFAARIVTGNQDFVMIDRREFLSGGVSDTDESYTDQALEGLGLGAHTNYASHSLRLSLLERRAPVGYRQNAILSAYNALSRTTDAAARTKRRLPAMRSGMPESELLQASLRHDIPSLDENLELRFVGIVPVNSPGYDAKGIEMALVPGNQPELLLIHEESTIAFNALERYNRSMAYFAQKSVPVIPFMRLPGTITDDGYQEFIDLVTPRLPVDLCLGPIETKFNN